MTVIVIVTAIVWILDMLVWNATGVTITSYLYFNKALILQGEVWRVVSFLFVPQSSNIFTFAISLYFYWLIGNSLENEWGSFKFDLFYLCGALGAIGSGFITGFATISYLHMSLFLAFALLYPNYQVLVFFIFPVKMKWLALIDLVGLVLIMIFNTWAGRIAVLVALLNVALFFIGGLIRSAKMARRRKKWQKEAKRDETEYPFEL